MIFLLAAMMDFVLLRKKPVGRMSCSSSLGFAYANAFGFGYFGKSVLATSFTRTSVHCADRIVEIKSWNGLSWCSSQVAAGYASSSPLRIARTRAGSVPRPATDLPTRLTFGTADGFFFDDFLYFFGIERKTITQASYRS